MPRHSFTILCLLLASTAPVLPESVRASSRARVAAEAQDEILRYTVKQGDTLQALASAHFIESQDWRKAQELNKLSAGAPLVAGSTLAVRQSWLKTAPIKAEIAAFRGMVDVQGAGQSVAASVGLKLDEGDLLRTGENGYVALRLPDASIVTLPSNSRIRLSRLREVSLTQSIDRRFALEAGKSEAEVTPMKNPASKFIITTPVSVAAVRGTDFRVSFTPAAMTARVEVIEGKVAVAPDDEPSGDADEALLLPDFGTVATASGVSKPIKLLAAPVLAKPLAVQTGKTVNFLVQPVAGAQQYVIELATDAEFDDRIVSITGAGPDFAFENVPNGSLHVRVAALDANGLTGKPAEFAFERRLNASLAGRATTGPSASSKGGPGGDGGRAASAKREASPLAAVDHSDASTWLGMKLEPSSNLTESEQESEPTEENRIAALDAETEEGDAAFDGEGFEAFGPGVNPGFGGGAGGGGGSGGGGSGGGWGSGGTGSGSPSSPVEGPVQPPFLPQPDGFQPVPVPPFVPPPPPWALPPIGENQVGPPLPPNGSFPIVTPPLVIAGPIPEPASWALLIAGFGMVGFALRRRASRTAGSR